MRPSSCRPTTKAYGFDNIADVLRVSPSLLEQYLAASAKIAALAVGDPDAPAVTAVYRAPSDLAQAVHVEGMPLGTRGGVKIRHNFPLDAEYEFDVFLLRNIVGYMTGLEWAHELEIAVDGERVFLAQVGGEADNAHVRREHVGRRERDRRTLAHAHVRDGRAARRHGRVPRAQRRRDARAARAAHAQSRSARHERLARRRLRQRSRAVQSPSGPAIRRAASASSRAARPTMSTARVCATEILSTLARRAYRRQPTEQDIATLLSFYDTGAARGGFDAGIESALRVILTSPKFLFRDEPDPAGVGAGLAVCARRLRRSRRGSRSSCGARRPTTSCSSSPRKASSATSACSSSRSTACSPIRASSALVENFAGQWLFLRNLQSARPDVEEFPDFDDNLRHGDAARDRALVRAHHARGPAASTSS